MRLNHVRFESVVRRRHLRQGSGREQQCFAVSEVSGGMIELQTLRDHHVSDVVDST